jgi:RHS repeat-associated protein
MVSIIDLRGNRRVRISYDANGRACQEEYADGGAYKFYYITVDQTTRPWAIKLLAEAKAGGPITVPPCSSAASNSRITYAIVVDPNGNPTTYRFNNSQKIVSVTNAEGQTTLINVNPITNLVTSRTDALGRTTKYTYDNKGNMKSMTDPAENTTAFEYEPNFNKPVTITDALGQVTSLGYDGRGNLTSITDAMGYTTTIVYDQFGQFIAITDPMDNGYTFEYDDKGNLIASIDPLGNKITRSYDAVSRLIEFTDPNGRNAIFDYDSMDRIRRVQDSLGKETTFDYDLNGNLLFITDANKNKRGYHYDVKNRLESTTDPLARTETYSYDFNDNFISVKDKKSETTFYTYDGLNRMIKATYADTSTVDHIYDPVGRLTRAEDSVTGPIDYAYTTFGCGTCARTSLDRIIQETTPLGIIKYTYDEIGRRKTMSVVGGSQVDYRYDKNGRLTEVSQTGLGTVKVDYDKAGRRVLLTLPNGVTTSYVYDKASQLLNMKHSTANAALEDLIYTNDAASNRISFDRISPQGELPKAATAAYNAANQMLNFADDNLTYDANGNLIEKRGASGTTTYTWDTRNQLIGINGPRIVANFKYDALGRRTVKTVNGKTMKYLYDGIDIHAEIDEGVVTATYLRGLNIDEAFARITEAGLRYYHADGLGSSIQLSDQNGAPTTIYSYDPFGNAFPSGAESDNPFQYTGRENDGTGLFYYRARYYSPELQRFISQDRINITTLHLPFEPYNYFTLSSISDEEAVKKYLIKYSLYHPETLNQYLYVYNNSTSHRDPTGEFSQFVLGAVAVILIVAEVVHLIHWSLHPQEELEAHLEKALPEPIDPLKEPPPEGPTTKKPPKQKPPKKSYCPTKKVWRPGK